MSTNDTAEDAVKESCWIIDIFPRRVSSEFSDGFFSVESWFLKEPQRSMVNRKKLHFLLKLNCYMHFQVFKDEEEKSLLNPEPAVLRELIARHFLTIVTEKLRITSDHCETCMVLYTKSEPIPELIKELCIGEGLYFWPA